MTPSMHPGTGHTITMGILALAILAAVSCASDSPPQIAITGLVLSPTETPVANALVAVTTATANSAILTTRSDKNGLFNATVPKTGDYSFTATAPGLTAAYHPPEAFSGAASDGQVTLRMGGAGITISGWARDDTSASLSDSLVRLIRLSSDVGDVFYTRTDADGRYEASLIPGDGYLVSIEVENAIARNERVPGDRSVEIDLEVSVPRPAPGSVVSWIKRHAVPLTTVHAGNGFDDMQPLRSIVGDARVVALGEATHGSREFFLAKHRMLEFLVEEMGFRVLAFEANWSESLAVNDYVLHGTGDPVAALAGLQFWTWNTEEVLAMVEWIRAYNAGRPLGQRVSFYGVDAQYAGGAAVGVSDYLERVSPGEAARVRGWSRPLALHGPMKLFQAITVEQRQALIEGAAALPQRLEEKRAAWSMETSVWDWTIAHQHATTLAQAVDLYVGMSEGVFTGRDRSMADNVEWILNTHPAGTRIALWAHNGHISRRGDVQLGSHLSQRLGEAYLNVGFAFGRGAFQAKDRTGERPSPDLAVEHTVTKAPPGSYGAAFSRSGHPIMLLDLRRVPADGEIGAWFARPHLQRQIGAVFRGEQEMLSSLVLGEDFDAVLFVKTTTRARPLGP